MYVCRPMYYVHVCVIVYAKNLTDLFTREFFSYVGNV